MNVNEIPSDIMRMMRERFEAQPKIKQLRVHEQMLKETGKFKEALAVAQQMDVLFNGVVYEYMSDAQKEAKRIDIADLDMPIEDKNDMLQLLLVCYMCSDIVETAIMDIDSVLHKHDKTLRMDMFDDVKEMMKMSKAKLKWLQENSGYMKDLVWADNCDNMYKMLRSKAGAIMRKRRDDPNWGKNMERFNEKK